MDKRYEQYCPASPFYGLPPGQDLAIANRALPEIHPSGRLDNSADIITRARECRVPRDISFKFVSSPLDALVRNAKYAPRGANGKNVTIYPLDKTDCELVPDVRPPAFTTPLPSFLAPHLAVRNAATVDGLPCRVHICAGRRWEQLGPDPYGGLAGFALAMLAVGDAAAEPGLIDAGLRAIEDAAG